MDTKTSMAALILMTASIFFFGEAKNAPKALAASQAGGSNQPAAAELGPWTPVCRYAGKVAAGAAAQEGGLKTQFCLTSNDLHVSTMIATVPNPELTHLSLSFDRYVESITWALDDGDLDKESYSFDGYWFPWHTDGKEDTSERERRSDTPGILLFRRNPQHPDAKYPHPERDLLLVFLVGETPTSGINRAAFEKAWSYATKLADTELPICRNAKSSSRSCVAIVGPSFTGSLPSLKLVLENANTTGYETFVISGAVTGEDPSTKNLPDHTHFCTTIETDENRWAVLRQVLANLSKWSFWDSDGELLRHFAILGEDETEYGNLQKVVGRQGPPGPAISARHRTYPKLFRQPSRTGQSVDGHDLSGTTADSPRHRAGHAAGLIPAADSGFAGGGAARACRHAAA